MKNSIWVSTLSIFLILSSNTQCYTPSVTYLSFLESLKIYRPNAPWITEEFMKMSFDDFEQAFGHIVNLLTTEQRWFYFSDTKQNFIKNYSILHCLWQCEYYDKWLNNVQVDSTSHKLVYMKDKSTIPLLKFWNHVAEVTGKMSLPVYQFYAFYCDCFTFCFYHIIENAYESSHNIPMLKTYIISAKKCLDRLQKLTIYMKQNDTYYVSYKMSLKKLKEVYQYLEYEILNN